MFLLMGSVAYHTGLTSELFTAARLWLSSLPGGLAVATNFASAGFATVSGSSLATSAAKGRIAIPEMLRLRYDPGLAAGVVAASGTLGSLIPPSILFVVYGVFTEQPISKLLIAGIRDPRLLERLDEYLDAYRAAIARAARSLGIDAEDYSLSFRCYGRDAVMGSLDPLRDRMGHEIGLLVDLVGKSQAVANALASRLGPTGSRLDIHGRLGGGGNFAYPFSPSVIDMGAVYEWSLWHIMDIDAAELTSLFPIEMETV